MADDAPNCIEFQEQLADQIASGDNPYNHPHLKHCEVCSALLVDLDMIAHQAGGHNPIDPPDIPHRSLY